MTTLTKTEQKGILTLFKEYTTYYNANSLSKVLDISHVGAQKMLKRFEVSDLTISKTIGKSIVHKPNLNEEYTKKLISFLLADEANNFKRWKEEFKSISKGRRTVMMYGSIIKNNKHANDIDIMIIAEKGEFEKIDKDIKEIQKTTAKKIHGIKATRGDFLRNIIDKNQAMVDIVKTAIILYGEKNYVELIKNVTGF